MPITPTGPRPAQYPSFWVNSASGIEFEIRMGSIVYSNQDADDALQSLVNHLAAWPDHDPSQAIQAIVIGEAGNILTPDDPE